MCGALVCRHAWSITAAQAQRAHQSKPESGSKEQLLLDNNIYGQRALYSEISWKQASPVTAGLEIEDLDHELHQGRAAHLVQPVEGPEKGLVDCWQVVSHAFRDHVVQHVAAVR